MLHTQMKRHLIFASLLLVAVLAGCGSSGETENEATGDDSRTTIPISLYTADTPDGALNLFLEKLGSRDYAGAFELQKNKAWGVTVDKFSSPKAFGGVVKTSVLTMYPAKDEARKKMIYAEITYQDEVNGDKTFKQKFYLQSFGGQWKIVDMKVVKSKDDKGGSDDIYGDYSYHFDEVIVNAYLKITKISDTKIGYEASVSSEGMTERATGTAWKQGRKYVSYNEPSVTFIFTKGKVVVTDEEERQIPYPISGTFKKDK